MDSATATAETITMNSSRLINQNSGRSEYYTPLEIIKAARSTMGRIELDPASSEIANKCVKADRFFTEDQDGLSRIWSAKTLWMNHPFSRQLNGAWVDKLVDSYNKNIIQEACCITFAATSEKWFRPLLRFPQCFLWGRTNYILPSGEVAKGVTKGSVVTYLGRDSRQFEVYFRHLGTIKIAPQ